MKLTANLTTVLPFLLTLALPPLPRMAVAQGDAAQTLAVNKDNRSIAITATDEVITEADVATVHIGYQLFGPDNDAAYANGSQASNAIIAALHAAGVPNDAIESQQQSVQATQPYLLEKLSRMEQAAHAFTITQSWTVRTNAADGARVLDSAVKNGANNSGEIDWSLRDQNGAQTEAAAKALQRARAQAAAMAAGLSVHLGPLLYASNQVAAEGVRPVMRAMAAAAPMAQKVAPLAINARHIHTSATVYAVFGIE